MTRELFYRYNPWWEGDFRLKNIIDRPAVLSGLKKHLSSKQIIILTGLRRVGKTTLLKLLIRDLIKNERVSPTRIFYISMDDYALAGRTLAEIIDEYRKTQKISFKEKVFLFLDEITYQQDFALQLKNLYDSQNVKIYASASSASVIKSKKAYLTGRHAVMEILPLDFEGYLRFKGISVKKSDQHLLKTYFEDYMQTGGIPEYVLYGEADYLRNLADDIIYKDIAALHGIKNIQTLKDFFLLLMERSGKQISVNKIANILDISPDTARRYLSLFEDSYLIYPVSRYGRTNERLLSPKKIYAADLGIRTLFTGFRDKGALFENYVFLKLKHLSPRYVYEEGNEIDFFTEDKHLIEVKYYDEMTSKQKALFEKTPARKKTVVISVFDLADLADSE